MLSSRLQDTVASLRSRITHDATQVGTKTNIASVETTQNGGIALSQQLTKRSSALNFADLRGNGPVVAEQVIVNNDSHSDKASINFANLSGEGESHIEQTIVDNSTAKSVNILVIGNSNSSAQATLADSLAEFGIDSHDLFGINDTDIHEEAALISRGRSWANTGTQILRHATSIANDQETKNAAFADGIRREAQEVQAFVGTDRLNQIQVDGSAGNDYVANQGLDKKLFNLVTETGEQVITGQDLLANGKLYPNGFDGPELDITVDTLKANSYQTGGLNQFYTGYNNGVNNNEIGGLVGNFFAKNPNGFIVYTDPSTGYLFKIAAAFVSWTPLVVDLDGDGVQATRQANTTYHDTVTGQTRQTTWNADHDDALLVRKVGSNYQLFGPQTNNADDSNGFTELAKYDDNGDGQLSADEAARHQIYLWKDNGNAQVNTGEILTFGDAQLARIATGFQVVDNWINGNAAPYIGSATFADGRQTQVIDVLFNQQAS
ncbi:MAG: hypothetical protein KC476_08105 [Cyanobacteria bacterium HKST-UBA06]|nr:hypothetical protein [Cyanobacteria bacterium HKST-UBA06]